MQQIIKLSSKKRGKLILVGVPIGNFEDLSPRARMALGHSALILCEDTRESSKLLMNFGITTRLISYIGSFDSAISKAIEAINNKLEVALIADRGMPCISDPGAKIVEQFRKLDIEVTCIPGASASITSYALTGYSKPFIFHGFLPRKEGDIRKIAQKLVDLDYNIIFFESPIRLTKTLAILSKIFINKEVTIARELTKTYEQILQFQIGEYAKYEQFFKGECVIIIKNA